jgi:hypothetical protein
MKRKARLPDDPGEVVLKGKFKYAGRTLSKVPSGYLRWLAENCYNDTIATAADREWQFREKYNEHFEEE